MKEKKRLLASTTLDGNSKRILFDLLVDDSQELKNKNESLNKFVRYYCESYNKYLVPKELEKLAKECRIGYINYISTIAISGSTLFNMDKDFDLSENGDGISISSSNYFSLKDKLINTEELYITDKNKDINLILISKMSKEEVNLLKNLYLDFMEAEWKYKNFLVQYKDRYKLEYFPSINTWDALYKLNPEWYDLLYNHLTNFKDSDLLSKTKFDKEINEANDINILMKKVYKYINE